MRTYFGIGLAVLAAGLAAPASFGQSVQTGPRNAVVVNGRSPYLGIGVQDIDADRARTLKLKDVRGAEVTSVVPDSPAAKAGFKEGDVVLSYNGEAVEGQEQLSRLVRETPAGRQVKIEVWRAGASLTLTPTVEERQAMSFSSNGPWVTGRNFEIPSMPNFNMPDIEIPRLMPMYQSPMLGIEGEALGQEQQLAEFFGVKDGVLVKAVSHNSAAEKAGIKAGDVIVKIEDSRVTSSREITSVLRSLGGKSTLNVTVVRARKELVLPVTLEAGGTPVRARARLVIPGSGAVIRFSLPAVRISPVRLRIFPRDRII